MASVRRASGWWWLVAAFVLLVAAVVLGTMIGPAGSVNAANWRIIWQIRLPRVVLAGIVGSMLSLAGASYQGVFRNPLVDPYLLGAAAGVESIVCILAMQHGVVPPTINYETPDPDCDLDYVPNTAREARVRACLNNTFGFGGHNAVLLFKRFE